MTRLFSSQAIWLFARLAGAAAGFAFQFCLARIMSPHDLGVFFSASSLAALLGIVCTQGYPGIAARFVSRYAERGRDIWLARFLGTAQRATMRGALIVASAVIAAAWLWPGLDRNHQLAFVYAGLCVPTIAAMTVFAAFGIAQRKIAAALGPDLLLRSMSLAAFAAFALWWGQTLDAADAMLGFCIVTFSVAALQACLIRPTLTAPVAVSRLSRRWQREAWTLLTVMLFTSFFGDVAIVAATPFLNAADVGAFGLAIKIAMIVGFGVQIAHQILQPDLSDLYARRRERDLAPVLLKGAAFPVVFSAAAVLGTLVFGPWVLRLYGPQFVYAAGPLLLLVVCQFVRALAGPSQNVLTLEGRQMLNLVICCGAVGALIAGNVLLARPYGLWGAAIAASAAYLFWVLAGALVLRARGHVGTDVLSLVLACNAPRAVHRLS